MRAGIFVLLLFLFSCGTAGKGVSTAQSFIKMQSKYRNLGYKAGYSEGYRKGYESGFNRSLRNFNLWKQDVLSLEAGKLLMKNGYISYPRIYRTADRREGKVIIEGADIGLKSLDKVLEFYIPDCISGTSDNTKKDFVVPDGNSSIAFTHPAQKIAFEKGYKEGFLKGFEEGSSSAEREAVKILGKYFKQIQEIETKDKYVFPRVFVSAPRVCKLVEGNTVTLKVFPSRVEPPRTIRDIVSGKLNLYALEKPTMKGRVEGIAVPEASSRISYPTSSVSRRLKVKVPFKDLPILEKLGIPYVIKDNSYYAVFFSEEQKRSFCKTYKICEEK